MNKKYKGKIYNSDHFGIMGKYYIALVTFGELPIGSLFYKNVHDKNSNEWYGRFCIKEWYGRFCIKHSKKEYISLSKKETFDSSEYVYLYIDIRRFLVYTLGCHKLLSNKELIKLNTQQFN